ncbi:FIP1 [Melia azedarach]|uniref:FIP1 n=1 Tax=Melia azedarach TaxID=155640 RepID=A0ACC1YDW6_MELAZ|nr:FIP1 [Melia azedarach]
MYSASDDDASPISNDVNDDKKYIRHGPVQEKRKHCRGMFHNTSVQKIHPRNNDASPMSDAEDIYYRDYLSVDCGRQKERFRDLGHLYNKDFSYYKEKGSFSGYERFGDAHILTVNKKQFRCKCRQSFRYQIDPCVIRKWDEREYWHEINARDEIGRNQYQYKRGCSLMEMTSLACEESRWLVPKYSSTLKTKRRSKSNKFGFEKRIHHDGSLLDNSREDDFFKKHMVDLFHFLTENGIL